MCAPTYIWQPVTGARGIRGGRAPVLRHGACATHCSTCVSSSCTHCSRTQPMAATTKAALRVRENAKQPTASSWRWLRGERLHDHMTAAPPPQMARYRATHSTALTYPPASFTTASLAQRTLQSTSGEQGGDHCHQSTRATAPLGLPSTLE